MKAIVLAAQRQYSGENWRFLLRGDKLNRKPAPALAPAEHHNSVLFFEL
jgi:hypothetical protein